jgi:AraC-like DNA-binding protein
LAAEWLRRPGVVSITEVAHGVGFKDSAHFARMFRARHAQSPRHWMRATAAEQENPVDQA